MSITDEELIEQLQASAREFELPPSIQSMRNIRAINAMNEAAERLRTLAAERDRAEREKRAGWVNAQNWHDRANALQSRLLKAVEGLKSLELSEFERKKIDAAAHRMAAVSGKQEIHAPWVKGSDIRLVIGRLWKMERAVDALLQSIEAESGGEPPCAVNHHKYVGKCPYCHTRLPGIATPEETAE